MSTAPEPVPEPLPPLSVLLVEAAGWIDQVAADLSGGAMTDRVLSLEALIDRLRLEDVRSVGALDADGVWAADGARSAASWIAARTGMTRRRAAHLVGRARDLRCTEAVEVAWSSGRIGEEVAFALLRARRTHPVLFDEQIDDLLGWMDGLRADHALVVIRHWVTLAANTLAAEKAEGADGTGDPDDTQPPDPAAENRVGFHQGFQGRWLLDGDFDEVTGAEINERVKAWIDHQFHHGVYRADDALTYPQRVAAAFDALTERGALEGQTKHQGPRPSVSLHLDARTAAGEPCDTVADAMSRRCNLADGTPVTRSTAERLLCTSRITAIASHIGPLGQVEVDGITDLTRHATAQQRKALALRDGGCVFNGCDVPPEWCEVHHLLPWEDGGLNNLHNFALGCKHHHHLLHEGGWTLWRATDGRLYLNNPDGITVHLSAHGQQVDADAPPPTPPSPPPRKPGQLRFLTPRERSARLAERSRRMHQRDEQAPGSPRHITSLPAPASLPPTDPPEPGEPPDAAPPPPTRRSPFEPDQQDQRRRPPKHGSPAA